MSEIPDQSSINPSDETDHDSGAINTKPGKGALIAAFCVGLLLVGGLAFSLYWFLSGTGGNGKIDAEMLSYLPAESQVIMGADLDALAKNSKLKELMRKFNEKNDPLKELNERFKATGLTVDDFASAVQGGTMGAAEERFSLIIRTKKPFEQGKMAEALGFKEEKKKGDKTYPSKGNDILLYPSDTLVVITTENQLETLAGKDPPKVCISEEMHDIVKKVGKSQAWVAVARSAIPEVWLKQIDLLKGMGLPYLPADLLGAAKDAKAAGLALKIDGEQVMITGAILCSDKSAAEKAAAALSKDIGERKSKELASDPIFGALLKEAPEIQKPIEDLRKTLKGDSDGSFVTLSGQSRLDDIIKLQKASVDYDRKQEELQMRQTEADFNRRQQQLKESESKRKIDEKAPAKTEKLPPPKKE